MTAPLFLTAGMGVGPELALKASHSLSISRPLVIIGRDSALSAIRAPLFSKTASLPPLSLYPTEDTPTEAAEVAAIRIAAEYCQSGQASAMVTGPIHKAKLRKQGFEFNGHTDFLGAMFDADPVMAFVGGRIRVALATTHIPLNSVSRALSVKRLHHVIQTVVLALQQDMGIVEPTIAVCGLNPHAGENGLLGREEINIISPACESVRQTVPSCHIVGPISAETAFFNPDHTPFDMIVAMYHDQGLVPLKALDFGRTVNWSMGLPILRLSVDHGTADSLVGTGKASPNSLFAALRLADELCSRRQLET